MDKNKKKNQMDLSNPYTWWGLVLLGTGVGLGGAIGGALGGAGGFLIIEIGKKDIPHSKKIGICILITIGASVAFYLLASLILQLF